MQRRNGMTFYICGIEKEMIQMNLFTKQKQTYRVNLWWPGEKNGVEGRDREFGINMYTLLYLKWITNKVVLYAQGTLLNVMWQPRCEESLGENGYMYMYAESLCCSSEAITLFIDSTPIYINSLKT